jgi:class 3 adenylate cyclase
LKTEMAAIVFVAVAVAIGAAIYAYSLFKRYASERYEHRRVLALFTRYMPAPVVEDLLARKDPRLLEAREYYATIVHVRIRNFALFAEPLSPSETLRYLNEFYTIVGQAVGRHRGFIESLRGDTVVAVFGVLIEERFQEERALRAALDIMRVVAAMESRWREQQRKAFTIGIGVNSGKIVAGDTGYKDRREFAIIGNPAHVAAQLEAASEELNASIVASETTYEAVRDLFIGIPTSSLPLKGLRRLQNAFIVRGLSRRETEEHLLTLPSQRSFQKTVVRAYETPEPDAIEPDAYMAPNAPPEEKRTVDERVSGNGAAPAFGHFSRYDDDKPALPQPPPVIGTYEDDQGPPVQLPP